ncbi:STAS domain-containing protein [Nonomuraea sp. NPDC050643]|uniref:STAS domain-containing protein n=1 Tax=Nonomuraea sp. NPDC050643 TaxID=3155660 RepID=UPI0033E8742E
MTVGADALIIEVHGALDFHYASLLNREVDAALLGPPPATMIIDLSAAGHCDSSGLAALVHALRRCRAASTHLVLTGLQADLERWLAITGLARVFDRRPHMADALPPQAG